MAVAQDLLDILRCPHCVSGPTRKPGDDPGRLALVRDEWLVCQEADCGRKYPIKEDIPVMLIDEGDKWINTSPEDLPPPGKLVEPSMFSPPDTPGASMQTTEASGFDQRLLLIFDQRLLLIGLIMGLSLAIVVGLFVLRRPAE